MRGTPETLRKQYPADLVEGILLHRGIDHFTDTHPIFLSTKAFLSPERRRLAGIVVDVFFDHFLTLKWQSFSSQPLSVFIDEIHELLLRRIEWATPELRTLLPRMRQEKWLHNYQDFEGLKMTFDRISQRRDFLLPLKGAEDDLRQHYKNFEEAFDLFYPEVISFAQSFSAP